MATLEVLHYPDPRLTRSCEPILQIDDGIRELAYDMLETMVALKGVGLAAPQVGRTLRMVVVDIWWPETDQDDQALILVNPRITGFGGEQRALEGCLSIPGVFEHVTRAEKIQLVAQNLDGAVFNLDADGFLAVALQHELDHLDGKLMLDRLSNFARKLALRKLVS